MSVGPVSARASWSLIVAMVSVAVLVVATRVALSSQAEWREGESALARADTDGAIVHFRRAARWYSPFSPYPDRALTRLTEIGAKAAKNGEIERALDAYRSVRGAIYSSRSFYIPNASRLPATDEQIAQLMAKLPAAPIRENLTESQRSELYLKQLRNTNHRPRVAWSLLALMGFVCWVIAAKSVFTHGFDAQGRVVAGLLGRYAAYFAIGFAAFAVGLRFA